MGLKQSSLINKVFKNRSKSEDKRGKHENHGKSFVSLSKKILRAHAIPNERVHYYKNQIYCPTIR